MTLDDRKTEALLRIHSDVSKWLNTECAKLAAAGAFPKDITIVQQGPVTTLVWHGITAATCTITFTNGIKR